MIKVFNIAQSLPLKLKRSFLRFFLSFSISIIFTILLFDFTSIKEVIEKFQIDQFLQYLLVSLTEHLLNLFRFNTYSEGKFLQILGQPGVIFEYGCLGIRHFVIFSVFIACYYGHVFYKIIYIITGNLILIIANVLRATLINIIQYFNNDLTQLAHDLATPIFMYTSILILWFIWVNIQLRNNIKLNEIRIKMPCKKSS